MWHISLSKKAQKFLDRLSYDHRERIVHFLYDRVCPLQDPYDLGDPLTGTFSGTVKFRCGDYRIIAEIDKTTITITVVLIGHRRDVYKVLH